MKIDAHTPCPACPVQWRELYANARVLAALVDDFTKMRNLGMLSLRGLQEAELNVRIALDRLAPLVDAHLANQDHALSVEPHMLEARGPSWPT